MSRRSEGRRPDDFHQDPFITHLIKLAVEDLLPRTEVEFTLCDGHDHLTPHHGSFQMSVSIVLIGGKQMRKQLLIDF